MIVYSRIVELYYSSSRPFSSGQKKIHLPYRPATGYHFLIITQQRHGENESAVSNTAYSSSHGYVLRLTTSVTF